MFMRKGLAALLGSTLLLAGMTATSDARAEKVKLGTLAPKKSPWGKVFTAWAKAVKKKSGGAVELKWYFNASQGDEGAMVAKMRAGQLDGAAVTSVGLGKIHKDVLALQMPGLCQTWACLDTVRNAMLPEFKAGMEAQGFYFAGTGDVGLARTMSKGKAIKSPGDLQGMKVYRWNEDPMASTTGSVIGYTGVPSSVPGLLPALSGGRINVITVTALAATQLQWAPQLDHMTDEVAGVGIGGLVFAKSKLDGLPADQKAMLLKTGKKAGKMLTKRIRKADKKAYRRLKKKMTVVSLSASEKAAWKTKFKEVRNRLGQGVFSPALVSKVNSLSGQ
jgi:TRAP-type C4-dicarboxylate transport system substrate-binding protein